MITRPMLASPIEEKDLVKLRYPLYLSEKLDGVRCLIHPELGAIARSFKPIPNLHTFEKLTDPQLHGFDGEIMLRNRAEFSNVISSVMSEEGHPDFVFYVFDDFTNHKDDYYDRVVRLIKRIEKMEEDPAYKHVELLIQYTCKTPQEVKERYDDMVANGAEGVIVRSPLAPYKSGRSTVREQFLLKMKPMHDTEGVIVGYEPLRTNTNVAKHDLFGLTERSSHKAGLVEQSTLGALILEHPKFGKVKVGTGFSQALRDYIWQNREELKGQEVTFAYQKVGMKNKPRFPSFLKMKNIHSMGG